MDDQDKSKCRNRKKKKRKKLTNYDWLCCSIFQCVCSSVYMFNSFMLIMRVFPLRLENKGFINVTLGYWEAVEFLLILPFPITTSLHCWFVSRSISSLRSWWMPKSRHFIRMVYSSKIHCTTSHGCIRYYKISKRTHFLLLYSSLTIWWENYIQLLYNADDPL